MEKEKSLTEKEKKRRKLFEENLERLIAEGYTQENLTISVVKANALAVLVSLPFMAALALSWVMLRKRIHIELATYELILFICCIIGLFVVHELIHGIAWGIFTKNHWRDIEFGIVWMLLTPYCTCTGALTRYQYIIGALMPTLMLGLGLGSIAIIEGNIMLLLMAEIMLAGGGADLLITAKLLRFKTKGRECLFYDHPTECGVTVFYK